MKQKIWKEGWSWQKDPQIVFRSMTGNSIQQLLTTPCATDFFVTFRSSCFTWEFFSDEAWSLSNIFLFENSWSDSLLRECISERKTQHNEIYFVITKFPYFEQEQFPGCGSQLHCLQLIYTFCSFQASLAACKVCFLCHLQAESANETKSVMD